MRILFLGIGILLLILLFFILKPQSESSTEVTTNQATKEKNVDTSNPKKEDAEENKKTFFLIVTNGKIVSGEKVLSVTQGQDVTIDIVGDSEDEIHLHGYDISVPIKPGEHVSLEFIADKTGRFSFELEHAEIELGALEVQPNK